MNYIIPYNADKGKPINLDLIVSIITLESPVTDEFIIRFYTTTPGLYLDWEYNDKKYSGEQEYKRVVSRITPEEDQ